MDLIREKLAGIIKELFGVDVDVTLEAAPKNIDADYSTNIAMTLARDLKRNPMEIASEIVKKCDFEVEIAAPGFLNFISPDAYFVEKIADFGKNFTKNISQCDVKPQTVICEFSDPNPFKVLHVGHLYTSIVGDSISRLLEFSGAKVVRANFGGDVGLHVGKTLYAVMKRDLSPEDLTIDLIADCYVEGTRAYDDDEQAHLEITDINAEIYKIAAAGEDAVDSKLAELYWAGRKLSYEYFEKFYSRIGVKFDKYYPESTVAARGLEKVKEELAAGVYEESDGAVVYRGEKDGLHTRVFINKNGLPTYEAKDVGLLFTKWDDYKFDKSIIITGNDIIDYMKVVLTSVSKYAPELVERTVHLTHGNVRLPGNEKMSSRAGNFIKAEDVLAEVEEAAKNAARDGEKISSKVVMGAVRYAFLKYKIGGDMEFDIAESVSMTGNSGPYLQYSAVRAKNILANIMKNGISGGASSVSAAAGKEWILDQHERELMKKLIEYPDILKAAVFDLAPSKICTYLYELAQEFSRFYENVKVAGSPYEFERGQIVLAYLKVITHGLGLLGIEVPEKM